MNFKRYQITLLFGLHPAIAFNRGLWFSGEREKGELISYIRRNGSWGIREHSWYEDGKKHGEYKLYSQRDSGKLKVHGFFNHGLRDGEYKIWGQGEELDHHAIYKNGEMIKDLL